MFSEIGGACSLDCRDGDEPYGAFSLRIRDIESGGSAGVEAAHYCEGSGGPASTPRRMTDHALDHDGAHDGKFRFYVPVE